jgi:hypothetical protein
MKVHSHKGWREVPFEGTVYVTDENDDVIVPDELGESLLEQEDVWSRSGVAKRPTVKAILAEVGTDPIAAAAALEAENASGEPRPTLVEQLTEIITNGGNV